MKKWVGMLTVVLGLALLGGCSGEGTVEINSRYEGAEIYIDGDLKGNMPLGTYGITLSEGKHEIELIKPILPSGRYDQYYVQKSIIVADKSSQSIYVSLSRRQSPGYKEQWEEKQRKQMKTAIETTIASIQVNMVVIPSGDFQMGSNDGASDEKPVHTVHINSFKMSEYEVTQAQWQAVMGDNPSHFGGMNNPVEQVSWNDIQKFINKLNQQTGKIFRLPSEAEWEYAARAGTTTKYSWGDAVGKNHANCDGCGSQWDNKKTAPVGSFIPNSFGLYDVHGNVWEWVQDCWSDDYNGAPINGSAKLLGDCSKRVLRGGSWYAYLLHLRSAFRISGSSDVRTYHNGFRLVQ